MTPSTPYGRLAIRGKYLISAATGQPVQLHGMSLYWSQWMAQYYNRETVDALKRSWNINVVRAAMGVEHGGYLNNREAEFQKVYAPLPYHEAVIAAIRANDPNNVIVVGTPNWSQYVDEAANDPITKYNNIAYTLHYYAGTHKQDLRNRAKTAINKNIALFVTEYGTVNADGNGEVDQNESKLWWNFLDQNNISYINWSIADKDEGASALKPGTTAAQVGNSSKWTNSGAFVRNKYASQNNGV
uniref:Glycoside hydrolase family 5 domain-containing protein n=1 Tax=Panagrolaimus davidi TaxID=227884 RepID=A0A914PHV7_9BILA